MNNTNNLTSQIDLIRALARREISGRYKGSLFGVLWSIINPLIMLIIYTFVFSVVFKAKWGITGTGKVEFAFLLFCGITAFNLFAEVVLQAPRLILNNPNYVKKIIFPLEILPIVSLISAFFNFTLSVGILTFGMILIMHTINWTILFLPVVILPLILLTLGLTWILSALGVYIRDISHFLGLAVQCLMFMSPIFYPVSSIPESYRLFFYINPLSYVVEDMRRIIIWGQMPDWKWLIIGSVIGSIVALFGYLWFKKTKGGFADVL